MGLRVDHVHPEELLASTQARHWEAVEGDADRRAELFAARTTPAPRTDRELSFGEANPSWLWGFSKLMLTIACFVVMHLLALAFVHTGQRTAINFLGLSAPTFDVVCASSATWLFPFACEVFVLSN